MMFNWEQLAGGNIGGQSEKPEKKPAPSLEQEKKPQKPESEKEKGEKTPEEEAGLIKVKAEKQADGTFRLITPYGNLENVPSNLIPEREGGEFKITLFSNDELARNILDTLLNEDNHPPQEE